MTENAVAREVVDTAYRIHTTLGPGLLESVYVTVLANQLQKRELRVTRQQPIPVVFEETYFDMGFRADLMVEGNVIIEVKSIGDVTPLWRVRRCQQCGYAMDSRPHHPGRWLVWLPCGNFGCPAATARSVAQTAGIVLRSSKCQRGVKENLSFPFPAAAAARALQNTIGSVDPMPNPTSD